MNVILLLLFIGLILVCGAVLFFGYVVKNEDISLCDRASLLPLEDEQHANTKNNI